MHLMWIDGFQRGHYSRVYILSVTPVYENRREVNPCDKSPVEKTPRGFFIPCNFKWLCAYFPYCLDKPVTNKILV